LLILSFGIRSGFGLFLQPMSAANDWGRDVLALALAIQNLAWGLSAVVAGGLVNRLGTVRVLLGGIALYGLGTVGMAYSTSAATLNLTAGIIVGAGIAGTSFGIVLPAIARAVPPERQGWALGIGTAAGSVGQFLVVPAAQGLIDWLGWLAALQLLGIAAFAMALCVIPLARYGTEAGSGDEQHSDISLWQLTKRALSVRSYVLLLIGFYVCGYHLAFITVHMPGYVVDLGFSPQVGAWSIAAIGLCNVVGAYYSGVLSGKRPKHTMLCAIYAARALAIAVFLILPPSLASILGFSAAMGFLWLSTIPPTSGLVAHFFGVRHMPYLYGLVFLSHQLGSFSGVWLGGYLYETTGNYDGIWLSGIALGIAAAALHWPIKEQSFEGRLVASSR
jgi:predicted MFS family arabinose efflux permease